MAAKKKSPKVTYTTVSGKKYANVYRDKSGTMKKAPKGKYVNSFGKMMNIPKPKKK